MFLKKHLTKDKISYLILTLIFISFIIGFFLRENSAGGGPVDLEHEWHNFKLLKENFLYFLDINYEASRFPLYHYLNFKINFFIFDKKNFVNSFFLYSFLVPIFFYLALRYNFKNLSKYKICLIVSLIFLSPFFRTSSYWGLQENLAYIFFFLSLISYQSSTKIIKKYLTIFLAFLSFYADQKFLIIPVIYFFLFFSFSKQIFNNFIINLRLIFFCSVLIIPALLIFYNWGGISGPSGNKSLLKLDNVLFFIQSIAIYLLPVVFFHNDIFKKILNVVKIKNILIIILYTIFYFFIKNYFFVDNLSVGGGWSYKIYLLIKKNNILFADVFYFFSSLFCFCLLLIYLNITKLNLIKIIIFIYYIFMSMGINILYQEYFDPIFNLIIIFYLNRNFFVNLSFFKLILINLYYFFFLISCVFFYS
jgi:hypothetical protein